MRRILLTIAALALSFPAAAQQAVMPFPLVGTGAGLERITSNAASSGTPVTGPLSLYGATVTIKDGEGPGYLMVWDATAPPADGVVSTWICIRIEAGPRSVSFGSSTPWQATKGIAWAFSSGADCQHKTAAVANAVAVSFKQARK